jgi:hypothetical protein
MGVKGVEATIPASNDISRDKEQGHPRDYSICIVQTLNATVSFVLSRDRMPVANISCSHLWMV